MHTPFHRARRTPALHRPFAGLACAAALALGAGPALAQSAGVDRVEISGHVVEAPPRYDVHASCTQIEPKLQEELLRTWWRERDYGVVDVRFVVTDGKVTAVNTRSGLSFRAMRDVRNAVGHLECPGAQAGTSLYRMHVVFADPDRMPDTVAGADQPSRIALVEIR
ncbi:hypothetical protein [Roseateles sp.]|uniref:hypothetical protein n=1 Tax=Roseateles sp. TaxID=1971397 RepID=UPI002600D51C|nr:hypothetical protein [Roseateles sp.]MBV8033881.1 hypothetical protein [Roseateles sp.]